MKENGKILQGCDELFLLNSLIAKDWEMWVQHITGQRLDIDDARRCALHRILL